MKFSIIVPMYNMEEYINKCIDSILMQSYKNFEIIVIDDGSKDRCASIVKKYDNKKIKYYYKKNGGLSSARNYGIQYAHGDYLLFVDSDDYINKELLMNLKKEIEKYRPDLIKFRIENIYSNGKNNIVDSNIYHGLRTDKAFELTVQDKLFEPAWMYAYNIKFYKDNNFQYKEGYYHEDFGLTPYILVKAKTLSSIDYVGYNYVRDRSGSIMTKGTEEKEIKKAYDMLYQADDLKEKVINDKAIDESIKSTFYSFLANACISRVKYVPKQEKQKYVAELKKRHIADDLLDDTLKRKIKKLYYRIKF